MVWQDQDPPATDVILHLNVPCAGGAPAYLEIDKRFAEPATSRRWCGTPMRWARADRSTTWCTPSGRCRGWVEVGLRRGRAAVVKRIWSENGPRRSMSKGAKAMVAACMFPEKEKGGRGKKASVTEGFSGVSSYNNYILPGGGTPPKIKDVTKRINAIVIRTFGDKDYVSKSGCFARRVRDAIDSHSEEEVRKKISAIQSCQLNKVLLKKIGE